MTFIFIIFFTVMYAVLVVYGISLTVRRWHDMGHSGWMTLLSFIPIINLVAFIFLWFVRGTDGPNAYGPANVGQPFWRSVFSPGSLANMTPPAPTPPVPPPPVQ